MSVAAVSTIPFLQKNKISVYINFMTTQHRHVVAWYPVFFSCNVGVRQGEDLSPFLFSLYINDLENYPVQNKLLVYKVLPNQQKMNLYTCRQQGFSIRSSHLQFCYFSHILLPMVVLHGPFGLPGFLFPRGVHFKDLLSMFSISRRNTRLKYLQRLFLILTFISAIYLLLMRSWHLIPITSIRRL